MDPRDDPTPEANSPIENSLEARLWLLSQQISTQRDIQDEQHSLSSVSELSDPGDTASNRTRSQQSASSSYDPTLSRQQHPTTLGERQESLEELPDDDGSLDQRGSVTPQDGRSQYIPVASAEDAENQAPKHPLVTQFQIERGRSGKPHWRPNTLRRPYLLATLSIALVIALVCVFLLTYSAINHGLGADDGSSAVLFGWRFTPTLIAVLYSLLTAVILNDVRGTEPFAQMSHPTGASPESSVLRKPGNWWNMLWRSCKRDKNHGYVNIFVLSAALVSIISSLLINPLSSALLQSQFIDLPTKQTFSHYEVNADHAINLAATDLTYFRTIGHVLQNLTTSAWITDKYVVVPFWPSSLDANLGTSLSPITQQWQVDALIMSAELNCIPMQVQKTQTNDGKLTALSDTYGCETSFLSYWEAMVIGSWFAPPNLNVPAWQSPVDLTHFNSTPQCNDRDVLWLMNTTVDSYYSKPEARAWSCRTHVYSASLPVHVTTGLASSVLSFDEDAFRTQRIVQSELVNQARFRTAFLARNWTNMIYTVDGQGPPFGGPSVLLAATYSFDAKKMLDDASLLHNAQKILQRFLGELVLASIADSPTLPQTGKVINVQRRVIVNLPIGISLAVLFIMSAVLVALILIFSRQHPLNLDHDPASVAAVVKLIDQDSFPTATFKEWDRHENVRMEGSPERIRYFLQDGLLSSVKSVLEQTDTKLPRMSRLRWLTNSKQPRKRSKGKLNWRPIAIRKLGGLLLLLLLAMVFSGILVLFILACTDGLYESAFTYRTKILPSKSDLFTFAPYSIVPTLLAVVVSLWWGNVDEVFRRLQPYVSMARTVAPASPNIGLSYLSAYPVWTATLALRNKHWFVALVSTGAILTQVLTVSMSALWQREDGTRQRSISLIRSYEPRSEPFQYSYSEESDIPGLHSGDPSGQFTLSTSLQALSTNWLYSATLELVYNGSEPGWSRDGWSFVPLDLDSIMDSELYRSTPSQEPSASRAAKTNLKDVNVTVTTPALRGALDCTYLEIDGHSSWTTEWDLTNHSIWDVSNNPQGFKRGYEINGHLDLGSEYGNTKAPILAQDSTVLCCANTASNGSSAIGYWSNNMAPDQLLMDFTNNGGSRPNFTMKWITGTPVPSLYTFNHTYSGSYFADYSPNYQHLIYPHPPRLSAFNCRPRVESSTATITVDMTTGYVQSYKMLTPPQNTNHPWTDHWAERHDTPPGQSPDSEDLYAQSNVSYSVLYTQLNVSYGVLFQDALMYASNLEIIWPKSSPFEVPSSVVEDLDDKNFNFKLQDQGLNVDLMSYSMYKLAGGDVKMLMDPTQMEKVGQKVFKTFFKHFVSGNVTDGGWGYQPINQTTTPASDLQTTAHVSIAVEVLQMSPVAAYISLIILFILMCITLFIYVAGNKHFKSLRHGFDDLASVIAVVHDSERLRAWVRAHPDEREWGRKARKRVGPYVRLGTFVGSDGRETWGVEVVEEKEEREGHR